MSAITGSDSLVWSPDSPPQNKPYHAKRPHKKSRLGCQNCKRRKVKCDEKRPSCGICILRGETCVFVLPAASLDVSSSKPKSPSASPGSRKSSPDYNKALVSTQNQSSAPFTTTLSDRLQSPDFIVVREPLQIATGCDAIDMKILWHFLGHTCTSFSIEGGDSRPMEDLMRKTVMDHAFSVKFLYNCVMALSCLHACETTCDDMGDPYRLIRYQDGVFEPFSTAIRTSDPKTYGALLANSLLLTALSSQNFRLSHAPDLYIIQWMTIWRGIGTIFQTIDRASLRSTGLEQLFYRPAMNLTAAAAYIPRNLNVLVSSIPADDPDQANRKAYTRVLRYLATLYQHMHQGGFGAVMKLRIITWFTYLPHDFVRLVLDKNCRALVILAHYAAFLKLTMGVWWLVGIGARSLRDICAFLGPAWSNELKIPLTARDIEDPIELARLVLDDPTWEPRRSPTDKCDAQEEQETRQLGLVDDQGRPVYYESEARAVVLANPSHPGDEPVWNAGE
ncbi:hypothetical protein H634G_01497 [Metarhizium anisopliae BRIP 53293]|uniref:Zn(2)-C6 fungal-type domain-containing protein n=1 Tax=Metarhizium anisopliae BRIP 53293 TaxID=1291518 RepID=A0A0D9PB59_METAN|nr:hypothetical protein H634G_01497 [Metarhizium anisopliae BRIP 53293]KJK93691.1 hypothetical protein H633G_02429 [Metarhizium anisopliae BRIP 53284]